MRTDIDRKPPVKLRRQAHRLALLFALILPFLLPIASVVAAESSSEKAPDFIWWENVEFVPTGKVIRGIPLSQIDPSWRLASELKKPRKVIARTGRDIMKEYGIAFSRQGDFNKDGREDLVTVGVYEDKKVTEVALFLSYRKTVRTGGVRHL